MYKLSILDHCPLSPLLGLKQDFFEKQKIIYVFSLYLIFVYKRIGWTIVAELSFDRLYEYFAKVPSIQKNLIDAYGTDGKSAWWFKFQIDVDHPLAWQTVQELGHVLNYISKNERLPTQFLPVSPPPYMNGEAKQFLAWVIQCNHPDFPPDVICDWLEARLPSPVEDIEKWKIKTDLHELDNMTDKDLDQIIPPNPEQ